MSFVCRKSRKRCHWTFPSAACKSTKGVYIKAFSGNLKKETPKLSLSPCHFKMLAKNKALEIGFDALESHKKHEERNMLQRTSSGAIVKCSTQDEIPDEEKNLGPHD